MPLTIRDPAHIPSWNDDIASFAEAGPFHTAEWARVLRVSYGYLPAYVVERDGARVSGVLPLCDVRSFITGRRGVSLPFTDMCPPLVRDNAAWGRLFAHSLALGRERNWKSLEFRGVPEGDGNPAPMASNRYFGHSLTLDRPKEAIWAGFRSSTRRNIQKAERSGVVVKIDSSPEGMHEFYRLNCLSRRSHGLPPQPVAFFKALHAHMIASGKGIVVLARHGRQAIAGAVFLLFNGRGIFKYGASDRRFLHLRANNLVMWSGIQWVLENGGREMHMGRTDLAHDGLRQFKKGWGTRESIVAYAKYDLTRERFLPATSASRTSYPVFGRMPMPLLRLSGQLLYRHIG